MLETGVKQKAHIHRHQQRAGEDDGEKPGRIKQKQPTLFLCLMRSLHCSLVVTVRNVINGVNRKWPVSCPAISITNVR
jgi:hypothetical protein